MCALPYSMFGDLLGSIAALLSGIIIVLTDWMPIDPLLSLAIGLLILYSTVNLLKDSFQIVMEGVPHHLNTQEIRKEIERTEGVVSVDDLHIWAVSSQQIALSAHIRIEDLQNWHTILNFLHNRLHHDFGIDHVTIQPLSIKSPVTYQNFEQV